MRFRLPRGRNEATAIAASCAAAAVIASGAAALAVISVAGWEPSVLIRMGPTEPLAPLAREADPGFSFVDPAGHGDGADFYAIARDPLALGEEHRLIDRAAYRYGHPGFSWLGLLVSGGRAAFLPLAFLLLGLAGMAVAAACASLIADGLGRSPWAGLLIALHPGLIYSVTISTSEPAGVAALALALLLWQRGHWKAALPLLAYLCLIKEWFVLVPLGLAAWESLHWVRERRRDEGGRRVAGLLAVPIPAAIWHVYVFVRLQEWSYQAAPDVFDLPPLGWIRTMRGAADLGTGSFDQVNVGHVGLPLLVVSSAVLVLAALRAVHLRTYFDAVFLAFVPVIAALNSLVLLYPKDLLRTLAVPLALVPAVLAGQRRSLRADASPMHPAREGDRGARPEARP